MVLDLDLYRADKGGDPEKLRENQSKRYKDTTLVDQVVEADTKWRKCKQMYSPAGKLNNTSIAKSPIEALDLKCFF